LWIFCGYNQNMAGRPKKPKGKARTNVLRIRLTASERKDLDAAAHASGLETSTWARFELIAQARKVQAKRPTAVVRDEPPSVQ
jgi:hypothetical protein